MAHQFFREHDAGWRAARPPGIPGWGLNGDGIQEQEVPREPSTGESRSQD